MGIESNAKSDEHWMQLALEQAQIAAKQDEVPVGAVLVDQHGELIASGFNQPISTIDPTAHAEIVVLRQAAKHLQNYRLIDTTLYVTLEPCVMCVGAIIHARVNRIVYGATEHKTGALESSFKLLDEKKFNHQPEVKGGILAQLSINLMSKFFQEKRMKYNEH